VFSGNRDALQRVATATLAEEGVLAIAVVDHLGDVLARSARNQNTLALPDAVAMKPMLLEHDAIRRIVEPIVPGSIALDDPLTRIAMDGQGRPAGLEVLGNVIIDLSQEPVRSQRAELQRNGALAVLFALVGALALAFKMSRGVSGPIREVARTRSRPNGRANRSGPLRRACTDAGRRQPAVAGGRGQSDGRRARRLA